MEQELHRQLSAHNTKSNEELKTLYEYNNQPELEKIASEEILGELSEILSNNV